MYKYARTQNQTHSLSQCSVIECIKEVKLVNLKCLIFLLSVKLYVCCVALHFFFYSSFSIVAMIILWQSSTFQLFDSEQTKIVVRFFFVFFWSHPNIKLPLAHGIHALNASGLIDEKATTNQNITRLELSRFLNFLMLLALFNHFWWTKMALLPCLA